MIRTAILTLILVCTASVSAVADTATITLRAAVRLSYDSEHVRLGDVAILEGADALALADVVIGPAPRAGKTAEVAIRQVREALDRSDVHWGRTHLNGRTCIVRAGRAPAASAPLPMAPVNLVYEEDEREKKAPVPDEPPAPQHHLASTLVARDDLRSAIANVLIQNLQLEPDRLQLAFDERDAALLDTPLAAERFEIEPVSTIRSGRVELAIRRWRADRIVDRRTISVSPEVLAPAVVVRREVDRGAVLTSDDVELEQRWQSPHALTGSPGDVAQVIGRAASTRLREGNLLREAHLRRETLVRRGELVTVRCIVGGAVISIRAEARSNASEGETIEFRRPGERDTFLAIVTARGNAVVDLARRNQ